MGAPKKYNRGRQIHYDNVPDDVFAKIVNEQASIKIKRKRGKVSYSEAITHLLKRIA